MTPQPGVLQFESDAISVDENAGMVSVTVTRANGSAGAVGATLITAPGTALDNEDFTPVSTLVSFADGDAVLKTFDIPLIDDTVPESAETFTVTLSSATGGAALGATLVTTITIQNDDLDTVPLPPAANGLNDTGVTSCTNAVNNDQPCDNVAAGTDQYPGQDGERGRDTTHNDDADGHAGFSFTKLDASGAPLLDQAAMFSSSPWHCVLDNVTGMLWEVKTNDGGLHDVGWTYTWFSSNGSDNDNHTGVSSGGSCAEPGTCDTQKFVAAVNTAVLCGREDWRLPTRVELMSLLDYGALSDVLIDTSRFPDHSGLTYWAAASSGGNAWGFASSSAWSVSFHDGNVRLAPKRSSQSVRLVSGGGMQ